MLSEQQAARLAWRVMRPYWLFYGRGVRARRKLREAALRGDMAAVRALGTTRHHGRCGLDDLWQDVPPQDLPFRADTEEAAAYRYAASLIALDPQPDVLSDEMRHGLAATAALDHPVGELARVLALAHLDAELGAELCRFAERSAALADFCHEHRLLPADPVDQVRFYLRTGRFAEYQAADPAGSLLQQAYRVASPDDQRRLRATVLDHGAADLLYTLVDHDSSEWVATRRAVDDRELAHLAEVLAARADWPALWQVVTATSVANAVLWAERFPPDWRPETAAEQRVLTALRDSRIRRRRRDRPSLVGTLTVGDPVETIAVAPDRTEVAVVRYRGEHALHLTVFDLATGAVRSDQPHGEAFSRQRAYSSDGVGLKADRVVHLGAGVVLHGGPPGLVRCGDGHQHLQEAGAVNVHLLAATGDRYVAVPLDAEDPLLLGSADDPTPRAVPLTGPGGTAPDLSRHHREASSSGVAFAPEGDKFVVSWSIRETAAGISGSRLTVFDATGALLADSGRIDFVMEVGFADRDLVVATSGGRMGSWRLDDAGLHEGRGLAGPTKQVLGIPGQQRLLVARYSDRVGQRVTRRLELLDSGTFEVATGSSAGLPRDAWFLAPAGAHGFAALTDAANGTIEVHDLRLPAVEHLLPEPTTDRFDALVDLLTTPVAAMHPRDLAWVTELGDRPAAALLRTCLEHRFGHDIHLGGQQHPGRTDVSLGEAPC